MSVSVYSVFMLSCVYAQALGRADPPSMGSVLQTVYRIKKLKKRPRRDRKAAEP
jgi:hypothetical protein